MLARQAISKLQAATAAAGQQALAAYGQLAPAAYAHQTLAAYCTSPSPVHWVFLGPPGVGKGTYASRAAQAFGVAHVAVGDVIRNEIKSGSTLGQQMKEIVSAGKLLPDDLVLDLVASHLAACGSNGWLLDGFPRTARQTEALLAGTRVDLALNLALRDDVLTEKCLGRRVCSKCGGNYNVADIYRPASAAGPEMVLPPLPPPPQCAPYMEQRTDDTEPVVRQRLEIYKQEAAPVENIFRGSGVLLDFEILGGIPETLPRLYDTLSKYAPPLPHAHLAESG